MQNTPAFVSSRLHAKIESYAETLQKSLQETPPSFRWAVVTLKGEILDCGNSIPFESEETLFSTEK